MKLFLLLSISFTVASCSSIFGDKHLNEKIVKSGEITVRWYQISRITSMHDYVDIERWGWGKNIIETNTDGIYDILVKGDTVTVQATNKVLVYELVAKTLNCHIKLDTSISICQYLKKYRPAHAEHFCIDAVADSSVTEESAK